MATVENVEVKAPVEGRMKEVLTPEALEFVARLHREFNPKREELLRKRADRQRGLESGEMPGFLEETRSVRERSRARSPGPRSTPRAASF